VVSCFIECGSEILLLLRHADKPQGGTWGVPAGKVETNESLESAIIREVYEETTIQIKNEELLYFKKVYVKFPTYDFVYHMFSTEIKEKNTVKLLASAHEKYIWVTPSKALSMNLIQDEDACIRLFYGIKSTF
jgi:8-oxo-dGTP pyrophosphatase MutT (NUDIX family)